MKKFIILLSIFALTFSVSSQSINYKYGKISNEELSMDTYEPDTSAVAVVLHESGYTSYSYNSTNGFQVEMELKKRIKILKQEGTTHADISIPYYMRSNGSKENITGLEATSYNVENGKIVKKKLEKKYIFNEEINNRYRQIKFSIPDVKEGTVIEYKYTMVSPFRYSIPDWRFQYAIPIVYSEYEVLIPEYFFFSVDATKGFVKIDSKQIKQNQTFNLGNTVNSNSTLYTFTVKDVPALKSEPYIWCLNDFVTGVQFEIQGVRYPNQIYKPYTNSWEDIEKALNDDTDFGTNMKHSNPYKAETKAIVEKTNSEEERILAIYSLVREKIRWNESYAFMGNNVRDAIKNGTGNNSQINVVLLNVLKDAGITAYPVLMSIRPYGRLPYTHPSLDKLNTFIVAAETSDGNYFYMDGSAIYGGLNVLPVNLLVDRARIFNNKQGNKWVDLTNITKNQQTIMLKASLDENGMLTCDKTSRFQNQFAYKYKSSYYSKADSLKYIDDIEDNNKLTVNSFDVSGVEPVSNTVNEKISFTKQYEIAGDHIYFNPMIFAHTDKNPFIQSERKLPIEFDYPYTYILNVQLDIPESYQVDEMPAPLRLALPDGKGKCTYNITQNGKVIQLNYRFELNQLIFLQNEYDLLQDFFGQIANKNTEMVVLKKM